MTQPTITIALGAERNNRMITITYDISKECNKKVKVSDDDKSIASFVHKQILSEVLEKTLKSSDWVAISIGLRPW